MITKEQIEEYRPNPQWARLDRDYYVDYMDITIPAGTIVQVMLYTSGLADLYVNNEYVTEQFPYDAATLLEDE